MTIVRIKTGLLTHSNHDADFLHGLPFEIWRMVFSFITAKDLCYCAQVCKDWKALVHSLDATRWKQLYLQQERTKQWKHPNWPNTSARSDISWKELYRRRYNLEKLWLRNDVQSTCTSVPFLFTRKKVRKVFHVGPNKTYRTIKAALDRASPYTKIIVHAGAYQDSSTLCLKYPVAILGADEPTKIVLLMQIEVRCESVKLENLTIAELTKTHSFRLLFRRFSPLG